jgi:hypothetical protein
LFKDYSGWRTHTRRYATESASGGAAKSIPNAIAVENGAVRDLATPLVVTISAVIPSNH